MDDVAAARQALARAIDDAHRAIVRVRAAQQVDWVSALASRFREELYATIQQLAAFRAALEDAWEALA